MNASDTPPAGPVEPEPKPGRFTVEVKLDARSGGDLRYLSQRAATEVQSLTDQNMARAARFPSDEVPAWSHLAVGSTPFGRWQVTFSDAGFSL